MARNVEIKARLRDITKVLNTLRNITTSDGEILKQCDTFYPTPNGRLKLREIEGVHSELIFYDRPDTEGPKLSSYEKYDFSEQSNLSSVLQKALGTKGIVRKERRLFMVGQTRVHVDEVEGLGTFIELEVVLKEDQSAQEGQTIAEDIMSRLEIAPADLIACAYLDLLLEK